MSPLLAKLKQFSWLFLPPFIFFSALLSFYFLYQVLVESWLANLAWMSSASLALASIVAWQFGRSRLVYACLLLLLINIEQWLVLSLEFEQARYIFIILAFNFLLYSQDKGFSVVNLFISSFSLSTLFLVSWLAIPKLQIISQPFLASIDNLLYQLAPSTLTLITSFEWLVLTIGLLVGLIRLLFKPDNTHNALFFAMALSAALHIYTNLHFVILVIVSLCLLFCYSVMKDNFTMAFKDELTGIPSRRALMQYVQTLGRKYTVVMADIDHFKKFNDTYGHDVGDEVLKLVASKLAKVAGGGKTFRYGGEEFIMLFPRKISLEAVPFVEIVRQTIADYDIALRAKPRPPKPKKPPVKKAAKENVVKVTTSFGIAQRTKEHADFTSVMKQADIALYAAKKAGRNCVRTAKQ